MSWKLASSLVSFPLNVVARASALSHESFNGVRFFSAVFCCWYSGECLQSGLPRKLCGICRILKKTVDRGPKKSELGRMDGKDGFLISGWSEGKRDIFSANRSWVSAGIDGLRRERGNSSSERYQACRCSKSSATCDTFL